MNFGIWKCGAAVLVLGKWTTAEDLEFFKKDSNVKFIIDENVLEEIKNTSYVAGYIEPNLHDAAYIVYTSGTTTGKYKGCLHEFGDIDKITNVIDEYIEAGDSLERHLLTEAPLYDIGSFNVIISNIYDSSYIYLAPIGGYDVVDDFVKVLKDNKITNIILMPKKLQRFINEGLLDKYDGFNYITVGYEPVKHIYSNKCNIYNCYGMSESAIDLAWYLIKDEHEITPVGITHRLAPIYIMDENGNNVEDEVVGEICFKNEYMRGYLNLEDETKQAFRNGIFHSNDIGKFTHDKNLVIYGRKKDIFMKDGKYIIPSLIESAVEKVLNVEDVTVKIFDEQKNIKIYAYYDENVVIDKEKTNEKLKEFLPSYMLPNEFIKIDKIPTSVSGKHIRHSIFRYNKKTTE